MAGRGAYLRNMIEFKHKYDKIKHIRTKSAKVARKVHYSDLKKRDS